MKARLKPLIEATKADELMVTTMIFDHAARKRSYELLAKAFALRFRDCDGHSIVLCGFASSRGNDERERAMLKARPDFVFFLKIMGGTVG